MKQKSQYDVIILGAGLSGLAAGYTLRKLGHNNFIILEARQRIGGRVYTKEFITPEGPLTVELGAEWISKKQRTIQMFCKSFGLTLMPHRAGRDLHIDGRYVREGRPWFNRRWKRRVSAMLARINNDFTKEQLRSLDQMSFADFLNGTNVNKFDRQILELRMGTLMGTDITNISAYLALYRTLSLQWNKSDGDDLYIMGGNATLADKFASFVGRERIRLASKIVSLGQDNNIVAVKDDAGNLYTARHVISTLPTKPLLTVDWNNQMPIEKLNAWHKLHYANVTKTAFIMNKKFWRRKLTGVYSDSAAAQVYHSTHLQNLKRWGALNSYTFGKREDRFLKLSVENQLDCALKALRLPKSFKANHMATLQKIWEEDPYTGGAYAVFQPGQWFALRPILVKPVGRIIFAGEHIHEDPGYMNSAIESGMASAKSLHV